MPIFDPCVAINSSRSNAALQSYLLQATRMVAQVRHVTGRTPVWSANHDHPLQAWTGHACQRAPVDVTTTVIRLPRVLAASTNRLAISGRLASSKVTILAAGPIANSGMTPLAERRRCSALSRKAWFAHRTSFSPRRAHAWAVPLRRWTGRQRKAWARLEETPNPPRSAGWLFPALHKQLQSPASPRGFFLSIANRPRATMACRSTTSRGIPAVRSTSASGLLFFWTAG